MLFHECDSITCDSLDQAISIAHQHMCEENDIEALSIEFHWNCHSFLEDQYYSPYKNGWWCHTSNVLCYGRLCSDIDYDLISVQYITQCNNVCLDLWFNADFRGKEQKAYIDLCNAQRYMIHLIEYMRHYANEHETVIHIDGTIERSKVTREAIRNRLSMCYNYLETHINRYIAALCLCDKHDFLKTTPFNGTCQVREITPVLPITYKEVRLGDNYYTLRLTWQKKYISRKTDLDEQHVLIVPYGPRKGDLYVELPSWNSTWYSNRRYLIACN